MKKFLLTCLFGALLTGGVAFAQTDPSTDLPSAPPEVVEQSPELKAMIEAFRTENHALRTELKAELAELTDPTRDEIRAATQAFRTENADRIAAQKALAEEIRAAIRSIREDRPRPTLPPELLAAHQAFRDAQQALRQAQRDLREALRGATNAADREAILASFREAQRVRLQALKDAQRDIREGRENAGDDRRG